jgi:hypothetical protein
MFPLFLSSYKLFPEDLQASSSESNSPKNSSSDSDSDSDSDPSDSDSDIVTPEFLESLLEKARKNYAAAAAQKSNEEVEQEEQVITLGDEEPYAYSHISGAITH